MRDIGILVALVAVIPFILKKPWIGIIAWVVVSVMNPHRLAFGFAYNMPIAQIIAISTLLGIPFAKDRKDWRIPLTAVTGTLILFVIWMNLTTLFALYPEEAYTKWVKVMKIMVLLFLGLYLLHSRVHLNALLWAIVGSIGFYAVKGGIFALSTGGSYKVWGPPESDVFDNNAISFATVMVIPLMYYLSTAYESKWIKMGLRLAIVLSIFTVIASHSRGAFLALSAGALFLVLKSDRRLGLLFALAILLPALYFFVPESWTARMATIKTYEEDASSMGRINTWWMCFNLAKDHPLFGGGFNIWNADTFARWAPDPLSIHAAHSIFFAALGEHGFVGLLIFLVLLATTWHTGRVVEKLTKDISELQWAARMGRMLQVALVGYVIGGAFLSVLYYDVFYYLIAALALLRIVVEKEISAKDTAGVQMATISARAVPATVAQSPATSRLDSQQY